jgi:hypothetical protein
MARSIFIAVFVALVVFSASSAADLANLAANTWVELEYTTDQPAADEEQGRFGPQGWNKIVYDPDGQRVLFYDRWIDKKHGGYTIYGNCLFAFDPAAGRLAPLKIDNWSKFDTKEGGYRTFALPANDREPTPAPRHVYHAFEYVSDLGAVFLCNGANQSIVDAGGKIVGHDACDGAWRLDVRTNRWTRINSVERPPNTLDDAMAYCPDTRSIVYVSGSNRQVWILDLAGGQFREAKQSPPTRGAAGQTIVYDPTRRRMLIAGGGRLEGQRNEAISPALRELFSFDPLSESVERLADCPTALYEAHLAYDSNHERFVTAAIFEHGDQPSGVFAYDPKPNAWHEIKSINPVPPFKNWFCWVQLCYDSHHDCFIGKVNERFYAFRYVPEQ